MTGPAASSTPSQLSSECLGKLWCPECHHDLAQPAPDSLHCAGCGRSYPVHDGVPRMVADASKLFSRQGSDNLERLPEDVDPGYEKNRFGTDRGRETNDREQKVIEWWCSRLPASRWIVDVPCGMGRFSEIPFKHGHRLCSIDLLPEHALWTARRVMNGRGLTVQGSALSLPLKNDAMDAAMCIRLSHHLDADGFRKLISELGRVARDVLVTYYNANAWGLWKKRTRGIETRRKGYTIDQVLEYAAAAKLKLVARKPGWTRFFAHPCQFVWLTRDGR